MNLYEITSSKYSHDEIGNKLQATVFVMAEDNLEAREKAKEVFKSCVEDHDQDFDALEAMDEEDLKVEYDHDVCLKALHYGAKGNLSCRNLGDVSEVVYHE